MNGVASTRLMVAVLAVVLLAGCRLLRVNEPESQDVPVPRTCVNCPTNLFVSPYYDQFRPRRVVIVTPQSRTYAFHDQEKFAESFANQLRYHGIADAVIAKNQNCNWLASRHGRFDEQQLVNLSMSYNADAVLYTDVTSFSAYAPMNASVSLTLVDARESVVLMSMDGVWDLRDQNTRDGFRGFIYRRAEQNQLARNVLSQSPTEFLSFAASEIAKFIKKY